MLSNSVQCTRLLQYYGDAPGTFWFRPYAYRFNWFRNNQSEQGIDLSIKGHCKGGANVESPKTVSTLQRIKQCHSFHGNRKKNARHPSSL